MSYDNRLDAIVDSNEVKLGSVAVLERYRFRDAQAVLQTGKKYFLLKQGFFL